MLTFANVTAFRASIDQAIYEREYTKTILNTVTDPLAVLSGELRLLTGNRAFYTVFRLSRDSAQSTSLTEIGNRAFDDALLHMRLQRTVADDSEFEPFEIDYDFPGDRASALRTQRTPLFAAGPFRRHAADRPAGYNRAAARGE